VTRPVRYCETLDGPRYPIGAGAVLYDTRRPERRPCCREGGRCLAHVTDVYEALASGEVRFRVEDGTHTTRHWVHKDDLLAMYVPAGWRVSPSVKPTYLLTRQHGVEDHHDVMTDGGQTKCVVCDRYYEGDLDDDCPHCSGSDLGQFVTDGGERR
jgi:hypothetical protein